MLRKETVDIQHKLARYCRTGTPENIPGITPDRIQEYRRLIYNVIRGNLDQAFPITLEILSSDEWEGMIDAFFEIHNAKTAQIWKLPLEFYEFAKDQKFEEKYNKPFLNELLFLEWLEIEVYTMPDITPKNSKEITNIMSDKLSFNLEFKIQPLKFPVHIYAAKTAIEKPGNYYVLIYREPDSGRVKFVDLSILHAFIVEQLSMGQSSAKDLTPIICQTFNTEDSEELHNHIETFLLKMHQSGFIFGAIA